MKHVLTVDPGLVFWAWALFDEDGKLVESKTVKYKSGLDQEFRLNDIYDQLCRINWTREVEVMIVERQFAELMCQIVGAIRASAGKMGVKSIQYVPASWRKLATGNGHAKEDKVRSVVLEAYPEMENASEHEIDCGALFLAYKNQRDSENAKAPAKAKGKRKLR